MSGKPYKDREKEGSAGATCSLHEWLELPLPWTSRALMLLPSRIAR